MEPRVAIIIVNWNGWRDTIECLESLKAVTYGDFCVYVVDNGSTDNSVAELSRFQVSGFRFQVLRCSENLGFAGGNNIGTKKALADGADYALLLNNDTIISPDFLTKLIETAESDPRIGIVGPKIYFADATTNPSTSLRAGDSQQTILRLRSGQANDRIWFGGGRLNWLKTRGAHIDYEKIEKLKPETWNLKPCDVDYITGCCLLAKRAVIKKIGLLSEDYFLYYEDVDWCLRARQAGFRVVYIPSSCIWHKVSSSAKAGSASYIYYHVRNGLMLAWRHGILLTRLALPFSILWTLAKQVIKLVIPSKRAWALATMRGVFDFASSKTGKL